MIRVDLRENGQREIGDNWSTAEKERRKLEEQLGKRGFPGSSDGKEFACNVGDLGSILGLARSPGEGNSYPLQYSCLENAMDGGAWQAAVHGVAKSQT